MVSELHRNVLEAEPWLVCEECGELKRATLGPLCSACREKKMSDQSNPLNKIDLDAIAESAKDGSADKPHDPVSNPHHYTANEISPLEFIEAQGMGRDFCLGNALKYIGRAGKKQGISELQDLKKAQWYLARWVGKLQVIEDEKIRIFLKEANEELAREKSDGIFYASKNLFSCKPWSLNQAAEEGECNWEITSSEEDQERERVVRIRGLNASGVLVEELLSLHGTKPATTRYCYSRLIDPSDNEFSSCQDFLPIGS